MRLHDQIGVQNAGVLNNMEIDDTVALFRKYLEGSCEFLQHEIVQRASV